MDTNNYKKRRMIGEILRSARVKQYPDQRDFARKLGRSQSYISKTEAGERKMDLVELMDYCDALGITLMELAWKFYSRLNCEPKYKSAQTTDTIESCNLAILHL